MIVRFLLTLLLFVSSLHANELYQPPGLKIEPGQLTTQVFPGDGLRHVAYEIYVTNFSDFVVRLENLEVSGKKQGQEVFVKTYVGEELNKIYSSAYGPYNTPQYPELEPGQTSVLYVFLNFEEIQTLPDELSHSIRAKGRFSTYTIHDQTMVKLDHTPPVMISPPLKGENWWTSNGPSNFSNHRRAILVYDGDALIPQRFAVDWVQFGEDGLMFKGDPAKNESYHCYGEEIYAVADGVVVRTNNGIEENVPGKGPSPSTIDTENAGGNYVILKLDTGHYAFYAHLIPNSHRVKQGERVTRGQVLGLLGNSGNSTAPHLHFQLTAEMLPLIDVQPKLPAPLKSEGVPYVFDTFMKSEYTFKIDPQIEIHPKGTPQRVNGEMIMNLNLVNFQ